MADRLDVCVVTRYQDKATGEEKSRWTRVGAAFATKNGGWSVKVDMPVTIVPGICDLVLAPVKQKEDVGF